MASIKIIEVSLARKVKDETLTVNLAIALDDTDNANQAFDEGLKFCRDKLNGEEPKMFGSSFAPVSIDNDYIPEPKMLNNKIDYGFTKRGA